MCVYIYISYHPPSRVGAHTFEPPPESECSVQLTPSCRVFQSWLPLHGMRLKTLAAQHHSHLLATPSNWTVIWTYTWWSLVISCDFWCILAGQIDLAAFCSNLSGRSVALTEMGRARGQLLDNPWCVMVPWCFSQFFSRSMGSLCGFQ